MSIPNPPKPSLFNQPFTFDRVFRLGLTIGLSYSLFLLVEYLQDVLIPFVIAALLAYILNPLVEFFQYKLKVKGRMLSIMISLIVVLGIFAGILLTVIPLVGREIMHMEQVVEQLAKDANLKQRAEQLFPEIFGESLENLLKEDAVQQFFKSEKTLEYLNGALNNIVPSVVNVFSGVFNILLGLAGLVVILLYLIFILIDYDEVMVKWRDLLHSDIRDRVVDFVEDFEAAMSNYFRAQTFIAFLVGVMFAIGFSIIGLPMAIIFGLFVGVLNLVPYLQTVAVIPAAFLAGVYCLENHENFWWMLALVLIVFTIVQLIQDAILTPKIMGKATGLNPAMMLLALAIWGKLLGVLGLIIALPITFLLVSYYKSFLAATGSTTEKEEEEHENAKVQINAGSVPQ